MEKSRKPKIRFRGYTDDWEQREFSEMFDCTISNNTLSRSELSYEEGSILNIHYGDILIKYGSILDIHKYKIPRIPNEKKEDFRGSLLQPGDIVIADTAEDETTGKACEIGSLFGNSIVAGLHTMVARPNIEMASGYLGYYLNSNAYHCQLLPMMQGIKVLSLSRANVKKTALKFPESTKEQQLIANYFIQLDDLITLHQRKLDKLINVKKSMLEKMFPKQGSTVPEIRFTGFTNDWEQRKLGEVVEFLDTMRKPLEGTKRSKGPYPYYGASGIVDYVDGYLFDEELILLSEDGANIMDRNYPVCFLASGKYWVNNHAHVLKVKQGNENSFVCNSLERKDYSYYNTGMAMPKLNKETCRNIIVTCSSFEEQKIIGDCFRKLEKLITLHQCELEKLQNIKKSMLEKMFV